ncbi:hypothetical protein, partial [Salmonella sp. s54836]|uniref:hypothetical protein n=1 Tax=Salmonella sp. s54836 TaxID=3159673 RepID=UPI00398093A8
DVDEYDEDNYRDDETAEVDSSAALQLAERESKVKDLKMQGKITQALPIILDKPPSGSKDKALKDKNLSLVLEVLTQFKGSEIESAVATLDSDQMDTLMKYIYK